MRRDLIHPHHDNELVQSQAACAPCEAERLQDGRDFVRFWLHNGFVNGASLSSHLPDRQGHEGLHGPPRNLMWALRPCQLADPAQYLCP